MLTDRTSTTSRPSLAATSTMWMARYSTRRVPPFVYAQYQARTGVHYPICSAMATSHRKPLVRYLVSALRSETDSRVSTTCGTVASPLVATEDARYQPHLAAAFAGSVTCVNPMLCIFPNARCCSFGLRMGAGRPWTISVELWRKHRGRDCYSGSLHEGYRVAGVDPVKACPATTAMTTHSQRTHVLFPRWSLCDQGRVCPRPICSVGRTLAGSGDVGTASSNGSSCLSLGILPRQTWRTPARCSWHCRRLVWEPIPHE